MIFNIDFQGLIGDEYSYAFHPYVDDMPKKTYMKFGYVDDSARAISHKVMEVTEQILTNDLAVLCEISAMRDCSSIPLRRKCVVFI